MAATVLPNKHDLPLHVQSLLHHKRYTSFNVGRHFVRERSYEHRDARLFTFTELEHQSPMKAKTRAFVTER